MTEVFEAKALSDNELCDLAQKALSKLCETGGRSFVMTVPPRLDDTDIILSEIIRRFEASALSPQIDTKVRT